MFVFLIGLIKTPHLQPCYYLRKEGEMHSCMVTHVISHRAVALDRYLHCSQAEHQLPKISQALSCTAQHQAWMLAENITV